VKSAISLSIIAWVVLMSLSRIADAALAFGYVTVGGGSACTLTSGGLVLNIGGMEAASAGTFTNSGTYYVVVRHNQSSQYILPSSGTANINPQTRFGRSDHLLRDIL
jgi:hypothetical protein